MKKRREKVEVKQSTLNILLISLSCFWILVLGTIFAGVKMALAILACVIVAVMLALLTMSVIAMIRRWQI